MTKAKEKKTLAKEKNFLPALKTPLYSFYFPKKLKAKSKN